MRKRILLFVIIFICMMISLPVFAEMKSGGNLNINMTYKLRDKSDYIQGNPFLCVYLYNQNAHYFVRLNYSGDTSKAIIKNPITGMYYVQYFAPRDGKEGICEEAVKLDGIPNKTIFREIFPSIGTNRKSLFAGGTMNLTEATSIFKVTGNSGTLHLKAYETYDNVIPAYYIKVTGTKVSSIDDDFHLYLYESDSKSTKIKRLQDEKRKKNRYGYFRNMVVTYPGEYFYLIKEKVPDSKLTTDKAVLIKFVVDYAGDRLCAKQVNIKRNGKVRKIEVSTNQSHNMMIAVNDPDNKNTEYVLYGPIKDTYPSENKDGSFNGAKNTMVKSGNSFSITMNPPVSYNSDWYSYNIVKKVNGTIEKGYTINIPFRWSKYKNGQMVTTWRVRPRVEFASVSSKK